MNGVHDMGGMDGYGPVEPEANEPVFHAAWEGRVMAMNRAMGAAGAFVIDEIRALRESLPPEIYVPASYFEKWLRGLERLVLAKGYVGADEIAAGHALRPAKPLGPALKAEDVATRLKSGTFTRPPPAPARFQPGDKVRARNINPVTHTRLPRYVRGHVGTVERLHGCHVFPDSTATGGPENPQWLYTVAFTGRELWGDDADPTLSVSVEAFEPYLEPA